MELSLTLKSLVLILGLLKIALAQESTIIVKPPEIAPVLSQKEERLNNSQGEVKSLIEANFSPKYAYTAVRIAKCESGFKNVPNYKYDGEDGHYTAYGIFQITKTTWNRYDCKGYRADVGNNVFCAAKIVEKDGDFRQWSESRECWDK